MCPRLIRLFSFFLLWVAACGLPTTASAAPYYLPGENFSGTNVYLLAGFGFEQLYYGGSGYTVGFDETPLGSVAALYSDTTEFGDYHVTVANGGTYTPRATFHWDGTNGSFAWTGNPAQGVGGDIATSVFESDEGEALTTPTRRGDGSQDLYVGGNDFESAAGFDATTFAADTGLFLVADTTPRAFSIVLDATGYRLTQIAFTAYTESASGGGLNGQIQWFFSVDGGALTSAGATTAITSATPTKFFASLAGFQALAGASTVTIVGRVSAPQTVFVYLDFLQLLGVAGAGATSPATISGTPPATAAIGVPFSFTFTTTGNPAPTLSLASGSLPPGITLQGTNLTGTPTTAGTYTGTISASNGVTPAPAPVSFSITVHEPATLSGIPPDGLVGNAYSFDLTVGGSPFPTVVPAGLPPGITLSQVGTGASAVWRLSGTPTTTGTFTGTLTATNGVNPAPEPLAFSITINQGLAFTSSAAPAGEHGVPYTHTLTASGQPSNYTFSHPDSDLPPGLSLNSTTGVISGTPTAAGLYAGTFRVSNGGASPAGTQAFSIAINAAPDLSLSLPLASSAVGATYSQAITATGYPDTFTYTEEPANSLPPGLALNTSTGLVSGSPTTGGLYTGTIRVSNGFGPAASQAFAITVTQPITLGVLPSSLALGSTYSTAVVLTGYPAPTVTLASGALPPGLTLSDSGVLSGNTSAVGRYTGSLRASNGIGAAVTRTFAIDVTQAPVFTSAPAPAGRTGIAYSHMLAASGFPTAFTYTRASGTLPPGLTLNPATGALAGTPTLGGTYTGTFTVSNTIGSPATQAFSITVDQDVALAGVPPTGVIGEAYTHTFTVAGFPAPAVTLDAGTLPPGLTLNGAALTGTPTTLGDYAVTFRAANGTSPDATLAVVISIVPVGAPVIDSPVTETATRGTAFTYTITASNSPTAFGATGLPAGLTLNSGTGAITGTPTAEGLFAVQLSATNAVATTTTTLQLTVQSAPAFTSAATAGFVIGQPGAFTITASGFPAPTFALTGAPAWLTLDAATGILGGTPPADAPTSLPLQLTATNGVGTPATQNFTLTLGRLPLFATTPVPASALVGEAFTFTPAVSGEPDTFTFALTEGTLPAGLSLDTSTGVISGTPSAAGETTVVLTATNVVGAGSASYTFAFYQRPAITSTLSTTGALGAAFAYQATASGDPSSWSATGLPDGLSLNTSTGLISGTPTTAGTFSITLTATNPAASGTATLVLAIIEAPAITTQPTGGIYAAGATVQLTVTASGNAPLIYQWRRDGVNLPGATSATLTLEGLTAGQAGFYTVIVSNAAGSALSDSAELLVDTAPVITTQPMDVVIATGRTFTLRVVATSLTPQRYQWRRDGTDLDGATAATLSITGATIDQAGTYTVLVSNDHFTTTSHPAVVRVATTPIFTAEPTPFSLLEVGSSLTLSIATDAIQPTIQWYRGDEAISGATSTALVLSNLAPADATVPFTARITNPAGSATSAPAYVVLYSPTERTVDALGGTFEVAVYAAEATADWAGSIDVDWLTLTRETDETGFSGRLLYTVAPSASTAPRSAGLTLTVGDLTAVHVITQAETTLLESAFHEPIDPTGETGTWAPIAPSEIPPVVLPEFEGRTNVVTFQTFAATPLSEKMVVDARALAAEAGDAARLISRLPLPADTRLRLEAEVFLDVIDAAHDAGAVGLGLTATATDISASGLRFMLAQAGNGASAARRGHLWVEASFLGEDGVTRSLDPAAILPRDTLAGRWVRLRVEISVERQLAFWIDTEDAEPLRVWAPATKAHPSLLAGQRLVLDFGTTTQEAPAYIAAAEAVSGYTTTAASGGLVNLSARVWAGTGDDVAIIGVASSGGAVPALVRAAGPALQGAGITDHLRQPMMVFYDGSMPYPRVLRVQDAWERHRYATTVEAILTTGAQVGAVPFASGALDSAWLYQPALGTPAAQQLRTVHVKGVDNGTGEVVTEFFALPGATARLTNLSARAHLPAGRTAIPGWIVTGNSARTYLIRAVGPGLKAAGLSEVLPQPTIRLFRGPQHLRAGTVWKDAANVAQIERVSPLIGASSLDRSLADQAMLVHLDPGAYTAIVSGATASESGIAICEIYEVGDEFGATELR